MPRGEGSYSFTLTLTLVLDGDRWLTPQPNRFTPGNDSVPMVWEAGLLKGVYRQRQYTAGYVAASRNVYFCKLVSLWKRK